VALYRKKPIEVEAVQNDGQWSTIMEWIEGMVYPEQGLLIPFGTRPRITRNKNGTLNIVTVDGNEVVCPVGAYVVIDSKGFPYPCDAEVFENAHERIK